MRILVVGGTGFIGLRVVQHLHNLGHDVTVFHRGRTASSLPEGVGEIIGDQKQMGSYGGDFRRLAPDVVVHMIAMVEEDARRAIKVFQGIARRVVVISSGDVYLAYGRLQGSEPGRPVPTPLSEESALRTKLYPYREAAAGPDDWLYNYDKILVERVFRNESELPATILRLPMVYGPGDRQHRLYPYLKRMHDKRPAILIDRKLAAWRAPRGYVENVGAAIALAAVHPRAGGRIYNVAEQDALTEREWIQVIARAASWEGEIVVVPADRLPEALRSDTRGQDLAMDSSRLRTELGYRAPVGREVALQRTITWELANPPEQVEFDYAAEDAALAALGEANSGL
jgi:nucleoside-diphosphate-sugar epimerase